MQATSRSSPMLAAGGRRTLMRAVSSSRWAAVRIPATPQLHAAAPPFSSGSTVNALAAAGWSCCRTWGLKLQVVF